MARGATAVSRARVRLSAERSGHATFEEVPDRVVGSRDPGWYSSRVGRSRTLLPTWVSRRRRYGGTSAASRSTRARREGLTSEEREEIRRLRREVFDLRRANEILESASVFLAARTGRTSERFSDAQRSRLNGWAKP